MIKNIVFDIGGVILHWNLGEMINAFTSIDEEKAFIKEYIYNSPEWAIDGLIDIGYITQEDFVKNVQERTNHKYDKLTLDFILNYYKLFHIKEDVVDIIKKLKSNGYNVYILSNINKYVTDRIGIDKLLNIVDGAVLSYLIHEIKPGEEIYKYLLNEYNLNPGETIFIDDMKNNIDTANKLGIIGKKVERNSTKDIIDVLNEFDLLG